MPAALLLLFRPAGLDAGGHRAFDRVAAEFPVRVRRMPADDHTESRLRLRVWTHDAAVGEGIERRRETGGWAAVLGNPARADLSGIPASEVPARVLDGGIAGVDSLSPPFAVALAERTDGPVHVAVDHCGIQHLYVREHADGCVWISSSLLALTAALGGTLDPEAAAEWLAAGHFISERTIAREVRKVGAGERLRLGADGCTTLGGWRAAPPADAVDGDYRRTLLDAVRTGHGDRETTAELTGGLDSRLILAARTAAGLPTRSWTIGDARSAELKTVARLQRAAGFEHLAAHVPLDPAFPPATQVLEMHELADGEVNALEYSPLLQAFAQTAGRWQVSMSGAGGETARGYYYGAIHDGRLDVDALVHKLAGASSSAVATLSRELFPDALGPLRGAVEGLLASSRLESPANQLEDVYLRGRMQRFAGRNTTTTGYFHRQALPFFDHAVVAASLGLPAARKSDGAVMRDALIAWAPDLARIPLDSGMSVAARSWGSPGTQARWAVAMGRKVVRRYGGAVGRRVSDPPPVPWTAIAADPGLRDLVHATLPREGSRVHQVLDPAATATLVDSALASGDLYSLGLVMTLELTLARMRAT